MIALEAVVWAEAGQVHCSVSVHSQGGYRQCTPAAVACPGDGAAHSVTQDRPSLGEISSSDDLFEDAVEQKRDIGASTMDRR